jgi:hypothetical protein
MMPPAWALIGMAVFIAISILAAVYVLNVGMEYEDRSDWDD